MPRPSLYEKHRETVVLTINILSRKKGQPPTLREISELTGISISTLHSYVGRLKDEGFVTWQPRSHRSIRLTAEGQQMVTSRT